MPELQSQTRSEDGAGFHYPLHKGHSAPHVPHDDAKSLLHPGGFAPTFDFAVTPCSSTETLSTLRRSARRRIMQELKFFIKGHGH